MDRTHTPEFVAALFGLLLLAAPTACVSNSQGSKHTERSGSQTDEQTKGDDKQDQTGDRKPDAQKLEIISQLPEVVDKTLPGVVGLTTQRVIERRQPSSPFGEHPFFRDMPFGNRPPGGQQRRQQGIGSGVIVDKEGTIVTNYHVVQGADEITVALSDRRDQYEAEILGTDEATDIAVLRMKNPPDNLQPLPIGDSSKLRLGQPVVAIGNPFGLSGTVTYGIVSAKGRQDVGLAEYEDFIQTDAAINPGNSGGALVNMEGELIGINTAILSRTGGYQGIGFAIPSRMVQSVTQQLIEHGNVQRGHLGVMIQTLSPELAEAFDLKEGTRGVVVSQVQPDSPADQAGLTQGDVIVGYRGKKVSSASDLRNRVAHTSPETKVKLQIIRQGDTQTIEVELGALESTRGGPRQLERQGMLQGLVLGPLDRQARRQLELPDQITDGVLVRDISPGSPASRTGLRPGDVILEVDRQPVDSVDDLTEAYQEADRRILLLVYRRGGTLFVPVPKTN